MLIKMTYRLSVLMIAYLISGSVLAANVTYQDPNQITLAVKKYLKSHPDLADSDTSIDVKPVNSRIKLVSCKVPLHVETAPGSSLIGKSSIKVSCSSPRNWSLYVTASIARYDNVYLSNRVISKGQIVRESDVYLSRKNLATLPYGYIREKAGIIGKQARRTVQAGHVIKPGQLQNPLLIKRGELVKLENNSANFSISMEGVAMMDGAMGDRIRVKNTSSNRIIEGKVIANGTVNTSN